MENKKKLQINCAICDTRNITEEILSAYEAVQINAATLVTSPEAQALLGRYRVCVNTAGTAAISGRPAWSGGGRSGPARRSFSEGCRRRDRCGWGR